MGRTLVDLATQSKRPPVGVVTMRHGAVVGSWFVYKPDGSLLDTTGTTTQGLQEAINYAHANGYPLHVFGGGVAYNPVGPVTNDYGRITCTTPIAFPVGWVSSYHFYGVNLLYDVAGGANAALDFITFDSADMYDLDMGSTQVIYPGTAAAVRFLPTKDNGESFAGTVSSNLRFGTIAVVDSATLAPKSSAGYGLRISMPDLGLGLLFGDGLFQGNTVTVNEINGGLFGIQIDNPGSGNNFSSNTVRCPFIHGQGGTSVKVGTSGAAAGLIYGNKWELGLTPDGGGDALHIWGGTAFAGVAYGGDYYVVSILNGNNGIIFQPSAAHNLVKVSAISVGAVDYVNSASSQTNVVEDSRSLVLATPSITTGTAYQNQHLKPELFAAAGGSISLIETSIDNSSWITIGTATGFSTVLQPGQYIRVTFTGSPAFREIY